jgi:uncharacterized protein (TIGR04551 family)
VRGSRRSAAALFALVSLAARQTSAGGLADFDESLTAKREKVVEIDGALRARGELLHNFDLDRGATPSGQLFYPLPEGDPKGQLLPRADLRLRTNLSFFVPAGGLAVKVRLDAPSQLFLGSAPVGVPSAATSQDAASALVRIQRVYAEALTPLGLLAIGRMGNQWGLGILGNGGDCEDCDSADAVDRVAFVTPVAGHLWALAYDLSSTGPLVPDPGGDKVVPFAPTAMVHTLNFAAMRVRSDQARRRRTLAGKVTFEYGALVSHRFQEGDVPATYLPVAQGSSAAARSLDASSVTARGFTATAVDGWARLTAPGVQVGAEVAGIFSRVEQASLVPGVLYKTPVTGAQVAVAIESSFGPRDGRFALGLDGGYASGDAAPGFGAFPTIGGAAAQRGDLDGPQANPPFDSQVQNFRFHPDYRVDRIFFREILGTVTDAIYVRPHAKVDLVRFGKGKVELGLFAVASFAAERSSTPAGEAPIGVELDPTLSYKSGVGFSATLEQATLIPLAGLDNPLTGQKAQPAQLWRLRLLYAF